MTHGSAGDGSWSRAFMAASGIGLGQEGGRTPSPDWHEASGAELPRSRFLALAHHKDPTVREALARRPDCPMGVLASLAHDGRAAVRVAAASNTSANRAVLEHLALDRDTAVLKAVARNAATPGDVLDGLCAHRRDDVRRVAASARTEREAHARSGDAPGADAPGGDARPGTVESGNAPQRVERRRPPVVYAPRPSVADRVARRVGMVAPDPTDAGRPASRLQEGGER